MKYIRTESDIYNIDDLYVCEELTGKPYATKKSGLCIYKDSIIKQADTIEELCDEFVVIDKTWEEPLYIVLDTKDDIETYLPSEIYGAIWTDKGLIYVAKMNDKGELELL